MATCGEAGGVSTTGRPCLRPAGWGVHPPTASGKCVTHRTDTTEVDGSESDTCGGSGGVAASTGRPCLRPAGWGFAGVSSGRCVSHSVSAGTVPDPTPPTPPPPPTPVDPLPPGEVVPDDRVFQPRRLVVNYTRPEGYVEVGETVELAVEFLGGRDVRDSMTLLPITGFTTAQTGDLTWEATCTQSGSVIATVRFYRAEVRNERDEMVPVTYDLKVGILVGEPTSQVMPSQLFDGTNRTDTFKSWLAALPHNSRIVTPTDAHYDMRCDYLVRTVNKWGHKFVGDVRMYTNLNASKDTDPLRKDFQQMSFFIGGDVQFVGWQFEQTRAVGTKYNEARETQHALQFEGTNGILLDGITARKIWGDFVTLSPEPLVIRSAVGRIPGLSQTKFSEGIFVSQPSSGVVIRNGLFQSVNRQCFGIVSVVDLILEDCVIEDGARTCWDVEPGANYYMNDSLRFSRNTVRRLGNFIASTGGTGEWMQNLTFEDNVIEEKPFLWNFPGGADRRDLYLLRNTCDGMPAKTSSSLVRIGSWKGEAHIIGNYGVHDRPTEGQGDARQYRPAVDLENCPIMPPNLRVEDNDFRDSTGAPLPLLYRQIHYQGNNKNNAVCRVIECLNGGEPAIVQGSADSCDWDS